MQRSLKPIPDWFFLCLVAVILAGCFALAWINPKWQRADSAEDRMRDLEMRCTDLEREVDGLKKAVYDTSGRVNDLEVHSEN